MTDGTVYIGQIVSPKSFDNLETISEGFIAVDATGSIVAIGTKADLTTWKSPDKRTFSTRVLSDSQFLLPGFIDCHVHAPQFPNLGLGLDLPLMDWLNAYTFPLEKRYVDIEFARKVYKAVVSATLARGTTSACYFGTIHKAGTKILAEEMIRQGNFA